MPAEVPPGVIVPVDPMVPAPDGADIVPEPDIVPDPMVPEPDIVPDPVVPEPIVPEPDMVPGDDIVPEPDMPVSPGTDDPIVPVVVEERLVADVPDPVRPVERRLVVVDLVVVVLVDLVDGVVVVDWAEVPVRPAVLPVMEPPAEPVVWAARVAGSSMAAAMEMMMRIETLLYRTEANAAPSGTFLRARD